MGEWGGILLASSLAMVSCCACTTSGRTVAAYPVELLGTWDSGPQSCALPVKPDADSPIHVEIARLVAYEHQETPVSIRRVSMEPLAWMVTAMSDVAPGIKINDLYIVKGDHLTVSDGESTRQYRRCK